MHEDWKKKKGEKATWGEGSDKVHNTPPPLMTTKKKKAAHLLCGM